MRMGPQTGREPLLEGSKDDDPGAGLSHSEHKVLLTIAGFDPSSGAGLTADLKVFAAHRYYGIAAATALTVQSTAGVQRIEPVSSALLGETLDCLAEDLPLAGIKIGMLATAANVNRVAGFLRRLRDDPARLTPNPPWVVLDPVMRSSSGHPLLEPVGIESLRVELLSLVDCVTPNVDELYLLAGRPRRLRESSTTSLQTEESGSNEGEKHEIAEVAALLSRRFSSLSIVVTGGHLARPDDYLVSPGLPGAWIEGEWVRTRATHGTGCAYSSALLSELVRGRSLPQAALNAKRYIKAALQAALPMGRGGGSMHHLYATYPLRSMPTVPDQDKEVGGATR